MLFGVVLSALAAATSVHFDVTTSQPRAQAAIERGLFLYYAYDADDAARSFEQAAAEDPHLAIAYWGIALANGPDLNTPLTADRFARAAQAIQRVASMDAPVTARERQFLAIMGRRYRGTFAQWQRNDTAYRQTMLQFARESGDENAALLAAEALLEGGGLEWRDGVLASLDSRQALDLVARVLRRDPASAMANHLCVHLYDLAPDRRPALSCAERLDRASFQPQAEHLAHMPAHYWIESGNYAAAMASSDRACALLKAMGSEASLSGGRPPRYARHDVSVGYSAAMMLGNFADAQIWAQRMESVYGQRFDAVTALRFGRYSAAFNAEQSGEFAGTSVAGLAALHLGRTREARAIANRLGPSRVTAGYMTQLFFARLAEVEGKNDEAVRWTQGALANQRADFAGELVPLFPAGEALGAFYQRRDDNPRAIAAFSETLAAYPNDPRAQFGLTTALQGQGQRSQAATSRARFEIEWKGADTDIRDALP